MSRRLRLSLIGLAGLAVLHTAAWAWAAGRLAAVADGWLAAERARGITIAADPPSRGGWPFGVTLTWPDMAITDPAVPLAWTGSRISLAASLLHPRRATLRLDGPQSLRLGTLPPLAITAESLDLGVRIGLDGRAHGAGLTARGLRIAGADTALGIASLSLSGDSDQHFALHADDITLPGSPPAGLGLPAWPLGPAIARLGLDFSLTGGLPTAPRATAAWMRAWRQAGGALAIDHLILDWGPLDLSAQGRLAADPTGQPIASLHSAISGWSETADALAAAGLLPAQALRPAKLALSVMAHRDAPGGPSTVELPLSLDDGVLSMRRVPLARLPPLP